MVRLDNRMGHMAVDAVDGEQRWWISNGSDWSGIVKI